MGKFKGVLIAICGLVIVPMMILVIIRAINGKDLFIGVSDLFSYISSFEFFKYTKDAISDLSSMVSYFDTLSYEGASVLEYVELIGKILVEFFSGIVGVVRDAIDIIGFIFGVFDFAITTPQAIKKVCALSLKVHIKA